MFRRYLNELNMELNLFVNFFKRVKENDKKYFVAKSVSAFLGKEIVFLKGKAAKAEQLTQNIFIFPSFFFKFKSFT